MTRKYASPFVFEVFDSRNTSTQREIPIVGSSVRLAQEAAKRLSMSNHHVIVSIHGDWEIYEKGERTEWSFPDGLPLD